MSILGTEDAAILGLKDEKSRLYDKLEDFSLELSQRLSRTGANKNPPAFFILVHGFQNAFETSVETLGRLHSNISCRCIPIVFSWPTSSVPNYIAQRDRVEESGKALFHFLTYLGEQFPGAPVHLLAHSMGGAVTVNALKALVTQRKSQKALSELVFAAADHPPDEFHDAVTATVVNGIAGRATSYVSSDDKVFMVRKGVTGNARAGFIQNNRFFDNEHLDTIDATGAIGEFKAHSNIYYSPFLMLDLDHVLDGIPKERRKTLSCQPKSQYCRIRKFK